MVGGGEGDGGIAGISSSGNTGTDADQQGSGGLSDPPLFANGATAYNNQQVNAMLGANTVLPAVQLDPASATLTYNDLDFSDAGAIMANMPDLYLDNAIGYMNKYGNVPFGMGQMGPPSSSCMDCSAVYDRGAGFDSHEWATGMGTPPGMYQVTESLFNMADNYQENADNFLDNANLQYGDLIVWPNQHSEFYAGSINNTPTLFGEQNSWGLNYYSGYSNFESFWNSWGQPNVYRQYGW